MEERPRVAVRSRNAFEVPRGLQGEGAVGEPSSPTQDPRADAGSAHSPSGNLSLECVLNSACGLACERRRLAELRTRNIRKASLITNSSKKLCLLF